MSTRASFASIEEYLDSVPPDARSILERIREIVERTVPDAKPTISYQMPAFRTDRVFIYFAAFKHHIGIYPPVAGDESLLRELGAYRGEKGNLKFPLDRPMPFDLICRVVEALARRQNRQAQE